MILKTQKGNTTLNKDIYTLPSELTTFQLFFEFVDFSSTTKQNNSILATIRHENCNITWETLSYLSEKVHLLHVEQFITPESPPPSNKIQATGIPPGVSHIQLTFINITEPVSIESYLMITAEPLVDVGSLIVQCFEGDKEANEVCSKPVVHFNVTSLEHTFPHLQALTLCGVFTQDTVANLSFPWDPNPLLLPLNLSHSKYNQKQLYNSGFPTQSENRKFTRALVVNGDMHIDIKQICPYQRSVNMLSIKQYPSKSIPADCLTPTEGHESDLYYLNFTRTKITELPPKLFKGLSKLK